MSAAPGAAGRQMVSVVVPVYNEAQNIRAFIRGISAALAGTPHEILVCYDFDADTTLAAIREMPDRPATVRLVKNDLGRGAAFAIRAGFRAAEGDVAVTTMADLSDPPEAIPLMAAKIRAGASVVSGSRYMKGGSQEGGPLLKRTFSRLAGLSLHWFAGVATHDSTTNFRAYSAEFLRRVTVESRHGFELGLELTVKAHLAGLKVDEVPSSWRDRSAGQSRFRMWKWMPRYLGWYWMAMRPAARAMLWRAVPVLSLVLAMAFFVPWAPRFSREALDPSWAMGIENAFATGKRFGQAIVFTMGPYGFLYAKFYGPSTFGLMLLCWALLSAALVAALWRVARRNIRSPLAALAWMAAIFALAECFPGYFSTDAFVIVLAAAFLACSCAADDAAPRALLCAVAAALALATFVKFTFAGLALSAVAAVLAAEIARGRRFLMLPAVFAAALPALWLLAGQRMDDFVPFLYRSYLVASGYNESMDRVGPAGEVIAYIGASAALLAAVAVAWRRERLRVAALLAGLLGVLFLTWKVGFTRHDRHGTVAAFSAAAIGLVFFPVIWRRMGTRAGRALAAGALLLGLFSAGLSTWIRADEMAPYVLGVPRRVGSNFAAALEVISGRSSAPRDYRAVLAQIRDDDPLPAAKGTVDVYPCNQAVAIAHRMDYDPRPVFQSYSAYLPELAELNLGHLQGADAPDTIFFLVRTIDSRFPSLDDGVSWPEILTRYDLCARAGRFLVFRRAALPREYSMKPAGALKARFGEWIDLPGRPQDPVWVQVDLEPTALNRALMFLFRAPWPMMTVRTADGIEVAYRIAAPMARGGFLLSPVVASTDAFAAFAAKDSGPIMAGQAVTSVRFSMSADADPALYFQPDIAISLYDFDFPAQPPLAVSPVR